MHPINLPETAAALPSPWSSHPLGQVGTTCVKVLRMNQLPLAPERHDTPEALLVLDGRLELDVESRPLSLGPGELYLVPARTVHAVRPGSHGTLVILEPS